MKRKDLFQCLYLAFMLLIMAIIFAFSHQQGEISLKMSEKVAVSLQVEEPENYEGVSKNVSTQPLFAGLSIRKYAHVILYAILGISTFLVMKDCKQLWWQRLMFAILICLVYSCTDEWHQTFIPGREAKVKDLLIDAVGYTSSIAICWGITQLMSVTKYKVKNNE